MSVQSTPAIKKETSVTSPYPPGYNPNPHQLTAAQIENRKYSIYIKNLNISNESKEEVDQCIREDLEAYGNITHLNVDMDRKTAIVRFKTIQ